MNNAAQSNKSTPDGATENPVADSAGGGEKTSSKRRFKPEERSQSLLNKCLNEKRRRDLENAYFEELAELISASITDMTSFSVKPEKCAILQESLNQIKQIKQEGQPEAVQQSQVSSSKPSVFANDILGPLLLEALDGFLFVVNSQGKVEFVSEHVTQYLKYTQDDLSGKSIYNIIHVGDHAQFSNSLLPMSVGNGVIPSWTSDNAARQKTFNCRMLIKPPCDEEDDVETKQTYVSQYENMQISAILLPGDRFSESTENAESCLVCIARRLSLTETTNTMLGIEQFTTKQDLNGKIIESDTSRIVTYTCPDFNGQNLQDFCHVNDVQNLSKHLQEVLKSGSNTSSVYRFKLDDNRYVFVQTKSKRFNNGHGSDSEFIMSTHSVIRECDPDHELKGSASTSLMKSIIGQNSLTGGQRNSNLPGLPQTVSPMAVLGALNQAFMSNPMNPASGLSGFPDELGDALDPFSSTTGGWDPLAQDLNIAGNSLNNGNFNLPSVSTPTSSVNSWNNVSQMKTAMPGQQQQQQTQQQQQLQRTMQLMQQRAGMVDKRSPLSVNFPRSNSFDNSGQKSPGFSSPSPGSRNSPFPLTNQGRLNMMNYPNQRSPGLGGQTRMSPGGGNMGMSYPRQRTPPVSNIQSGNVNQSSWGRMQQHSGGRDFNSSPGIHGMLPPSTPPTPQASPLQALQSMDSLSSVANSVNQAPPHLQGNASGNNDFMFANARKTPNQASRPGKLCALLTQNQTVDSFNSSMDTSEPSGGAREQKGKGDNHVVKSQADSMHQSPCQSPPEKPQSTTSNDEGDTSSSKFNQKPSNVILKKLLSQEGSDDEESNECESSKLDINMDKNEAEAKKPSNELLKKLLSDENLHDMDKPREKKRNTSGELLQVLLKEQDGCTSAPAESTSQESDFTSRQRHQSGPQEPQSTTSTPASTPPAQITHHVTSLLQAQPQSTTDRKQINRSASLSAASSEVSQKSLKDAAMFNDRNLDNLLHSLWEKDNDADDKASRELELRYKKRKLSAPDPDTSDTFDHETVTSANISQQSSKLMQKNALLAQLLSKKAAKETVINTQSTVNPCSLPQSRLSKNLQEKLISLKPNKRLLSDDENHLENPVSNSETVKFNKADSLDVTSPAVSINGNLNLNSNMLLTGSDRFNSELNDQQQQQLFQEQYEHLQQLLSATTPSSSSSAMDISQDSTDPLLANILQQAADLQQDLTTGNLPLSTSSSNNSLNSGRPGSVHDENSLLQQIEKVLEDPDLSLPEIDNLLGLGGQLGTGTDINDRMAIDAIQKQLMNEEFSLDNITGNVNSNSSTPVQNAHFNQLRQAFNQGMRAQQQQQLKQQQQQQQRLGQISPVIDINYPGQQMAQHSQPSPQQHHHQQQAPALQPGQQSFDQAAQAKFGLQGQGPRLQGPQGPLASALQTSQQQRPMFGNPNPNSTAMQVRQSLLQQQKLKQIRDLEKRRLLSQQEQQRIIMQRQISNQFGQRFPSIDNSVPSFPENLAELMNSGTAPNVSLQRNQGIPGPMSPRFTPQSPQSMGQISPHFNQPQQTQWNSRQQQQQQQTTMQAPVGIPQGSQFNLNRHRSLSGGSVPNSGQQGSTRFQFPESQFGTAQGGQMGMFSQQQQPQQTSPQQQQSMFSQNRMLQRQMSMPPGRGSPRTPHSPYNNSPDPLLMSPHSISPNNSLRQQQTSQVSPPFNQSAMQGNFVGPSISMAGGPQVLAQSINSQSGITSPGFQDFDMQLSELESKKMDLGMNMGANTTHQYVKQELRNICNARSEKQLQQSQAPPTSQQLQQQQPQQLPLQPTQQQLNTQQQQQVPQQHQQQQQQQQQSQSIPDFEPEIPYDILEQITELAKEHNVQVPGATTTIENFKEDDVLKMKRQEAKQNYDQLCELAKQEAKEAENNAVKATALFHNQLKQRASAPLQQQQQQGLTASLQMGRPDMMRVNVIQKESRSNVEDIKPADHKNSLLQQLLSE